MHELSLPWGVSGNVEFPLPEGWSLRSVLKPRYPEKLPELDAELERALKNTIALPPLHEFARRGPKACVLIDDRTRPTPVKALLPRVMEELAAAGVRDENIIILVTLGTHRDMTEAEIRERIGDEMAQRYKVVQHHYLEKSDMVFVGNTPTHKIPVSLSRHVVEADTVVSIGCIEAHEQAGTGGGYKNIMPGVSGPAPIHATHNAKFQKPERISSAGCPKTRCRFRIAVDEAGALLGPKVFIVNAVLDPVRVVAVVAGDPVKAHEAGTKIYCDMAAVVLDEPADIVIASARPLDLDLRVSMKACFNAAPALKPGGLFIMVSEAAEGLGDLRVPASLPAAAKTIIKKTPLALLEPIAMKINTSPDQAAGTMSLMKLLKTADRWMFLTSMKEGVPALSSMGIEFFNDPAMLLKRAVEIKPKGNAVALPNAGASFIAWD